VPDCRVAFWELQVSGDVSPPGGSRLKAPGRPARQPGRGPVVSRADGGEPSLARVFWTTLRLWWRRRVLRVPDGARLGTIRWTAIGTVIALIAAGCVALVAGTGQTAPPPRPRVAAKPDPAQLEAVANERAAGQWVAAQVAPDTTVACDPSMCGYLINAGAGDDVVLGKGSAGISAAMVVSTPALRAQSGSLLADDAPEVIAAFGAGPTHVDVLVATTSAAAFLATAHQAVTASARLGRTLARSKRLHIGPAERRKLTAGQVDKRLLVMLQHMLARHSVYVASFGDADPGASWPAQLRSLTIDDMIHHSHGHLVNQAAADLKVVHALQGAGGVSTQLGTAPGGGPELVIQVPAPS
jgi:hypothetical protein